MADDRLYLKCRRCGDKAVLMGCFSGEFRRPGEGHVSDFIEKHMGGCFELPGQEVFPSGGWYMLTFKGETCFALETERGAP